MWNLKIKQIANCGQTKFLPSDTKLIHPQDDISFNQEKKCCEKSIKGIFVTIDLSTDELVSNKT